MIWSGCDCELAFDCESAFDCELDCAVSGVVCTRFDAPCCPQATRIHATMVTMIRRTNGERDVIICIVFFLCEIRYYNLLYHNSEMDTSSLSINVCD